MGRKKANNGGRRTRLLVDDGLRVFSITGRFGDLTPRYSSVPAEVMALETAGA
jgi:hypothetical protein